FRDTPAIDEAAWTKATGPGAAGLLADTLEAYETAPWQAEALRAALEALATARGLKLGKAQAPVRVAVTGRSVGLPLFESLEVLGRERTVARLRNARDRMD